MDRTTVMNMLSLIPERTLRRQSGSAFAAREGRAASLSRYLSWLSPLNPMTKDDQAAIGYSAAPPRIDDAEDGEGSDEDSLAPAEAETESEVRNSF
jgi:hypothetical protein